MRKLRPLHGRRRPACPRRAYRSAFSNPRAPAGNRQRAPGLPGLLTGIGPDTIGALLLHIWTTFTAIWPELSIHLAPFAAWLDSLTATRLDGSRATLRAAVRAGVLDLANDRDAMPEVDLLGRVYQELQKPGGKKAHGELVSSPEQARDSTAPEAGEPASQARQP